MIAFLLAVASQAVEICTTTVNEPGTYEVYGYTCYVTITDGAAGSRLVVRQVSEFTVIGENAGSPTDITMEIDDDYYQGDYAFTIDFQNINVNFEGNGVIKMQWSSARFTNTKMTSKHEMDIELVKEDRGDSGCVFADYTSFAAAFGPTGPLQKGKGIWTSAEEITMSAPLPNKPGKITFTPTNFVIAFDSEEQLTVEDNKLLVLKLKGTQDIELDVDGIDDRHSIEGGVCLSLGKAQVRCTDNFKQVHLVDKIITIEASVLYVPYDDIPTNIFAISEECLVVYQGKKLICLYSTSESECSSFEPYNKVQYHENMNVEEGLFVRYVAGSGLKPKLTYASGSASDVEFASAGFVMEIHDAMPDGIRLTSSATLEIVPSKDVTVKRLISPGQDKIIVSNKVALTVTEEIEIHHSTFLKYLSPDEGPWKSFNMNDGIKATFHLTRQDASFDVKENEIVVGTTVFARPQFNFDALKFVTVTTTKGVSLQCTGPSVASGFTIQIGGAFETLTLENEWRLIKPTPEKTIKIHWTGSAGKLKHPLENFDEMFTVTGNTVSITKIDTSSTVYQYCLYSATTQTCPRTYDQAIFVSDGNIDQVPEFTSVVYYVSAELSNLKFKIGPQSSTNVSIQCSSGADISVDFKTQSMSVLEFVNAKAVTFTGSSIKIDRLLLGEAYLISNQGQVTVNSLGTSWNMYESIIAKLSYNKVDLTLSGYAIGDVMHPNDEDISKVTFGKDHVSFSGTSGTTKQFSLTGRLSVTTYSKTTAIGADSVLEEINKFSLNVAVGDKESPHAITIDDALEKVSVRDHEKLIISAADPNVHIIVSHPFFSFATSICEWKPWTSAYEDNLVERSRTSKILFVYLNNPAPSTEEVENVKLTENSFTIPSNAKHYNITFEDGITDPVAKFASNSCPYITLKNYPGKVFLSIDTLPETVSFRFENCTVVFTGSDRTITADSIYLHGVDISLQGGGGSCKLDVTKGAEIHMDVFEKLKTNVFTGGVTINELRLYNSDEEFIKSVSFLLDGWKFTTKTSTFDLKKSDVKSLTIDIFRPDDGDPTVFDVSFVAESPVICGDLTISVSETHICLVLDGSWKQVNGWVNNIKPTFIANTGVIKVLYEHDTDIAELFGDPTCVEFYDNAKHNFCVYDSDSFAYLAYCWKRSDSYPLPVKDQWEIAQDGTYVLFTSKPPRFAGDVDITATLISVTSTFDFNFRLANLHPRVSLTLVNEGSGIRKASFPETVNLKSLTLVSGSIDIALSQPFSSKISVTEHLEMNYRNFKTHFGDGGLLSQWFNVDIGGKLSVIDETHFKYLNYISDGWELKGEETEWMVSVPAKNVHGLALSTKATRIAIGATTSTMSGPTSCTLLSAQATIFIEDSFQSVVMNGQKLRLVSHASDSSLSIPWVSIPMTIITVEGVFGLESRAPVDERTFCVQGDSGCGIEGAEVITTSNIECSPGGTVKYYVTKDNSVFTVMDKSSASISIIGVGSKRAISLVFQKNDYSTNVRLENVQVTFNTKANLQGFEVRSSRLSWRDIPLQFSTGSFSSDYESLSEFAAEIHVIGSLELSGDSRAMYGSSITTFTFDNDDASSKLMSLDAFQSVILGMNTIRCLDEKKAGIYLKNVGLPRQQLLYSGSVSVTVDYDGLSSKLLTPSGIPRVQLGFNSNSHVRFVKQLPELGPSPVLSSNGKNLTLALDQPNHLEFAPLTSIISDFMSLRNLLDISMLNSSTLYVDTLDTVDEVQLHNHGVTLISGQQPLSINKDFVRGTVSVLHTRRDKPVSVTVKDGTTQVQIIFYISESCTLALGKGFSELSSSSTMIIIGEKGSKLTWEEDLPPWIVISGEINDSGHGLSQGAIAAIVVAVIIAVGVAVFLGVWFGVVKKRRSYLEDYDLNESENVTMESSDLRL